MKTTVYSADEVRQMMRDVIGEPPREGGTVQLAEALGVSKTYVYAVLSGICNPSNRVAEHFGLVRTVVYKVKG
jgi:hypothetical protein